ncbi:cyclic-phosphate processing receiver domain-containing protein [Verrucomicrobiota bacterium]
MKKRILVLEDQEDRREIFREIFKADQIVFTEYVDVCIDILKQFSPDVLYLDHDLGTDETGYDVACWLEEHKKYQPKTIYLHTANIVGRDRMKQALPKAIGINFEEIREKIT